MSKMLWEIPCPKCGLVVGAHLNGEVERHPKSGQKCDYIKGDPELHYELNKELIEKLRLLKAELGITEKTVNDLQKKTASGPLTKAQKAANKSKKAAQRKASKKASARAKRVNKQRKEEIAEYWDKRRSGFREVQGGSPGLGKGS